MSLTVRDFAGRVDTQTATVSVTAAAVCVPQGYDPSSGLEIPHTVWDGLEARLKAVVFTDTPVGDLTCSWDFGGGSEIESGPVTNKRVVDILHQYNESVGALFTATLTIDDPVHGLLSHTYPVIMEAQDLYAEINVAIDNGLWFVHQNRRSDGLWRAGGSYSGYYAGATASAIQAFAVNGHLPGDDIGLDPYVHDVESGLDAMFTLLGTTPIGVQTYGDPDSNANGFGVGVSSGRPIYESGQVMDAIAASAAPDRVANAGGHGLIGRTYYDILQDMVDIYAWGQVDSGGYRGGWRYSWNAESDNCAAQWGAIGFLGARDAFGLDAPAWVKDENLIWLGNSQHSSGYFGYTGTNYNSGCYATAPSGMVQLAFDGIETSDDRWVRCEDWLANQWGRRLARGARDCPRTAAFLPGRAGVSAGREPGGVLPGDHVHVPGLCLCGPHLPMRRGGRRSQRRRAALRADRVNH